MTPAPTYAPVPDGTPLRVAVLSLAHVHAASYVELLSQRPDVELVVADPEGSSDPGRAAEAASLATRPGVTVVASYDEALALRPDAVVVCAENSRHRPLVEQAAAAGADVLCEKPLATTLLDARAMIDSCSRAGVRLMTAYPVRFHPAFAAVREAVRGGALGRVHGATGINVGRAPLRARPWFVDPELAGGGCVTDHTVHLADLLDELVAAPAVEVYARTNRIVNADAVEVETGGLVLVTYGDGTVASIDCSWVAPGGYPAWGGLTLDLHCEHGEVSFDAFSHRLDHYGEAPGGLRWMGYDNLDVPMVDAFLTAVRSGTPVPADGEVGYRTLAIVDAAYRSAASGLPVDVTGPDPLG